MRYVINPDGLIVNVENGEVVDTIVIEVQNIQLDYYNNHSH
jgi:hypothetical protein